VFDSVDRGSVTVQVEGIGTIAGPPARATIFDVGSADVNEQKAAASKVVEVCNMVTICSITARGVLVWR
jgi:hypothetical protein